MNFSLGKLFMLLRDGYLKQALSLFGSNADEVHIERFKRVVSSIGKIVFVGEYIVIELDESLGIAIIGVDENGRFFVHFLRPNMLGVDDSISAMDVRRAMGFDVHFWEVERLREGLSIRLQGDIVVRVVKIYDSLDSLLRDLWDTVIDLVARTFIKGIVVGLKDVLDISSVSSMMYKLLNSYLRGHPDDLSLGLKKFIDAELLPGIVEAIEALYRINIGIYGDKSIFRRLFENRAILRELYGLGLSVSGIIDLLRKTIKGIHGNLYRLALTLASKLNEGLSVVYLNKALEVIANQERRIRFLLGRHTIEVIGITLPRLMGLGVRVRSFGIRSMRGTVIVMRNQEITARHPQHGVTQLRIDRPCIIEIGTLDSTRTARTTLNFYDFIEALFNALGLMDYFRLGLADIINEIRSSGSFSQVGLYLDVLGKNWTKISKIVDYVVNNVMRKTDFRYRLARIFYYAIIMKITSELRLKIASILVPRLSSGKYMSKRKIKKMFRFGSPRVFHS